MAPSLADDLEFRAWWERAGRRGASPSMAQALNRLAVEADLRAVLPLIATPRLVVHRRDNTFFDMAHSRYLADHIAGAQLLELDGQDHLPFVGETDELLGGMEEFLTGSRGTPDTDRVLTTIMFADIVESTRLAAEVGDRHWHELLDSHDSMAARQVRRFAGRRVSTTGDGFLATFDGPALAIQCGLAVCDGARQLGLEVRVGVHTGEVERRGADVAGIGVHIAARVQACARPSELWVSRTVTDLVAGSGLCFADRGEHSLKGVPGTWRLFAVES